ncbi:hypothetical protein [Maridesulfovibrio sp. FT414]|uniref:hypothetical protein n=1 Tax=Maridesulfovibrio sp. FT414 TaxID=2979469 RepID=UPI003D809A0E
MEFTNMPLISQIEIILVSLIAMGCTAYIAFITPKILSLKAEAKVATMNTLAYACTQSINLIRISAMEYRYQNAGKYSGINMDRISIQPTYQHNENISISSTDEGNSFILTYSHLSAFKCSMVIILQSQFWKSISLNGEELDQDRITPSFLSGFGLKEFTNTIVFTSN